MLSKRQSDLFTGVVVIQFVVYMEIYNSRTHHYMLFGYNERQSRVRYKCHESSVEKLKLVTLLFPN
jgi:hypothetical protein